MPVKILTASLPLLIGVSLAYPCTVPAWAQSEPALIPVTEVEPLTPAEGSAEDLEGLESRSGAEAWGVGGANYPDSVDYGTGQSDSASFIEPVSAEEQWQQQNRGETPDQKAKFPVSRF